MLSSRKYASTSGQSQPFQAWDFGDLASGSEGAPRPLFGASASLDQMSDQDDSDDAEFTPMWGSDSADTAQAVVWTSFLEDLDSGDPLETETSSAWFGDWQLIEFGTEEIEIVHRTEAQVETVDQTEILKELFEERQRIEAERMGVETLRQQAETVLQQAHEQEQSLLSQARLQAAARVDEANVQNELLQRSFQARMNQMEKEIADTLATARSIAEEARAWRDNLYTQGETTMLQLVMRIGQTLFGDGFALDPTTLGRAFARALTEAHMLGHLRIYVNPADAAQLSPYWLEQQATVSGQKIELAPSESIKRGGCYIDGQFGAVDALVESQFQAIRDTLMANMPSDRGDY